MPDSFRNRRFSAAMSTLGRFHESSLSDCHSQPIALSHRTEVVTIAFVYVFTRKEPYQLMYVIVIAALAVTSSTWMRSFKAIQLRRHALKHENRGTQSLSSSLLMVRSN
jgi:hypothetical protein